MGAFREVFVGPPGAAEDLNAWLRSPPRWPVIWWVLFVACFGFGAFMLGVGVVEMEHLYRHPSERGLRQAVWFFAYLFAHAALGVSLFAARRLWAAPLHPVVRRVLMIVVAATTIGLISADVLAPWVLWRTDRLG